MEQRHRSHAYCTLGLRGYRSSTKDLRLRYDCFPLSAQFSLHESFPGGLQSNIENTNLAEAYDPSINQWQYIAPMREHRYRPGAAVVNEKIFVCGGQDELPGKYHESVESYSVDTDQWTIITELICGRSFLACAMLLLKWSDILWEHVCEGETNSLPDIG